MQVKDFENFEYSGRKPWILWLLILVILLIVANLLWSRRKAGRMEPVGKDAVVSETNYVASADDARRAPAGVRVSDEVRVTVRAMLTEARAMVDDEIYHPAREMLFEALAIAGDNGALRREVETLLGKVHIEMVMTPRTMPEKIEHQVRSGDIIARIARDYGTTPELVQRGNGIANPNLIRVGQRLRVINKPFSVHVNIERNDLVLKLDGRFFKRYAVGTGKYGSTPIGTFEVTDRIPEPVWWRPDGRSIPFGDPENILGTHWLAIKATGDTEEAHGYGIHGTWNDDSIGQAESAGCVRMHNHDVEELFTLLPLGTPVTIVAGD